jgi:hypothetical protein
MDWTPIILMALAAAGIGLTLVPPRAPRQRPPKSRSQIRAEWARERRHWAGAPDLREGGE